MWNGELRWLKLPNTPKGAPNLLQIWRTSNGSEYHEDGKWIGIRVVEAAPDVPLGVRHDGTEVEL